MSEDRVTTSKVVSAVSDTVHLNLFITRVVNCVRCLFSGVFSINRERRCVQKVFAVLLANFEVFISISRDR